MLDRWFVVLPSPETDALADRGYSGPMPPYADEDFASPLRSNPATLADPWPMWSALREAGSVVEIDGVYWVTRYEDVRRLKADFKRLSNDPRGSASFSDPLRATMTPAQPEAYDELNRFGDLFLVRADGARHDRLRRVAQRVFTPRRIAELEAKTTEFVAVSLDELARRPIADMMELAYQVPLMIIGELLGVPAADRAQIKDWSDTWFEFRYVADDRIVESAEAGRNFRAYVEEMISAHRSGSTDSDLLTALMTAEQDDRLSSDELAAMFFVLLFAGHETTTNLIGTGLLELLRHRDQWEQLCRDPDRTPAAVEELLRFVSPVQWDIRVAVEDVDVEEARVPAGSMVMVAVAPANRDPRVYSDPDDLDIARPPSPPHLAFGFGPHYCLGASLARLEAGIAFRALATRFPHMELATDELVWRGAAQLRGLAALPVPLQP